MKALLLSKKTTLRISFLLAVVALSTSAFSQSIPELMFTSVSLESGNAGEDGATYRFSNVASGIDAVVEIRGRSSALVVLSSIDTSGVGLGYDKAFQPVLGILGTAPANLNWSMDFRLIFYKAGTNTKLTISEFHVTGLDIDGDGLTLSEWTQVNKIKRIDSALVNSLTFTQLASSPQGDDYKIEGIIANSPGIDTTATNVMASYKFENTDKIDFTIGAKTSVNITTAGMRLNSLWFREFFNPPLPVKMMSFTATSDNTNKADLKWITASEMSVSHFSIERSIDGNDFKEIGIVFANGNTSDQMQYNFSDNISSVQVTVIYYRLRSVDIDGKSEFSSTRMIRISKETSNVVSILTYPNPVSNELRITIPANWQNKKVLYEVLSFSGQAAKKIETAYSSQTEILNISKLNSGIYIVNVTCENKVAQQKIIKQ